METELCTGSEIDFMTTTESFDLSDETGIRSVLYRANGLVLQCDALMDQCSAVQLSMQEHADLLTRIPLEDVDGREAAYIQIQKAEVAFRDLHQKLRMMNVYLQQAQRRLLETLSSLLPQGSDRKGADMEACIERLSQPLSLTSFGQEIERVADILNDCLSSPIVLITHDPLPAPPPAPPRIEGMETLSPETQPRCDVQREEKPVPHVPHSESVRAWIKETTDDIRQSISQILYFASCRKDDNKAAHTAAVCLRDLPLEGEEAEGMEDWDDSSGDKPTTREQAHTMLQRAEAAYHRRSQRSLEQHERIFSVQQELGRRIRALLETSFFNENNDPEGQKRETFLRLLPSLQQKHPFEGLQELLREVDTLLAQPFFRPATLEHHAAAEQKEVARAHVRWMIRRDTPEVLGIEAESFEFPWLEEDFIRCLKQRNCIGMVAELDDRVVGFMIFELNKTRIHVLNFAVAAEERRKGVASQMLKKLVDKLSYQRRSRITLEVRETNAVAQLCFRKNGFRAISVLRNFYDDTLEDAYLMQRNYKPE